MNSFISNLISNSSKVSHKRIIALISFLVLIGMVVLSVLGHPIAEALVYVFGGLCGGQSAFSVVDKFSNKNEVL